MDRTLEMAFLLAQGIWWGDSQKGKLPDINPVYFPGHLGSLLNTWCPSHVKIRYWFANVKQLNLRGWWLVANRADVWSEPLWRYLSASDCELWVRQRSISYCFPRNMKEWRRDGVGLISLFIFAVKWAFLGQTPQEAFSQCAWATLHILLSRGRGTDGLSAWLMTSPSTPLGVPSMSPGSPVEPCGWLLTTMATDRVTSLQISRSLPIYTYTTVTGSLEAASRNSLLAGTLKDPSRDSIHTSFWRHPTLRRELGMGLRGIGRRQCEEERDWIPRH